MNTQFSRFQSMITSTWFAILLLMLVVLSYVFIDRSLTEYFHQWPHPILLQFISLYTRLGSSGYSILALIGLSLLCSTLLKKPQLAKNFNYLLLCVIVSGLICDVFKIGLGRARPIEWFQHQEFGFQFLQWHANHWSFPSGHSTTIAALMMGIAFCYPRIWWLCLMTLVSVSLSRVVVTAHFLSDTFVGMYLGILTSTFLYYKAETLKELVFKLQQRSRSWFFAS